MDRIKNAIRKYKTTMFTVGFLLLILDATIRDSGWFKDHPNPTFTIWTHVVMGIVAAIFFILVIVEDKPGLVVYVGPNLRPGELLLDSAIVVSHLGESKDWLVQILAGADGNSYYVSVSDEDDAVIYSKRFEFLTLAVRAHSDLSLGLMTCMEPDKIRYLQGLGKAAPNV